VTGRYCTKTSLLPRWINCVTMFTNAMTSCLRFFYSDWFIILFDHKFCSRGKHPKKIGITLFFLRVLYRHGRKEVFVNLLVRKIIYDCMYPVDLENNERSCEYSSIVVPTSKDIVTQPCLQMQWRLVYVFFTPIDL
jgi:hypothetical protein